MHDATCSTRTPHAVDNTDWLKTAAVVLVAVDHIGYFFIEDADWWSVFGRLAAPAFFFLLGYAQTRTVPLRWIWLGVILTLLESWNAGWTWVAPNILLSLAIIRIARPYLQIGSPKTAFPAAHLAGRPSRRSILPGRRSPLPLLRRAGTAVLFVTTFWSFVREFSPHAAHADRIGNV